MEPKLRMAYYKEEDITCVTFWSLLLITERASLREPICGKEMSRSLSADSLVKSATHILDPNVQRQ